MAAKKPKADDAATTEQSKARAEASQALDSDKTPPIGGLAPDAEKAATGDKNPPEGEAGSADGEVTQLIAMHRDAGVFVGGPTTADVHSSEVENWKAGGWVIDQAKQSEGEHAKTTDSTAAAAADASTAAVADGNAANGAASDSNETGGAR